jgi:formate-dependent nitrite reductase membrane component NrfD
MEFEPVWGVPIIAMYLFLAGLGGGAFMTSALRRGSYPECYVVLRKARALTSRPSSLRSDLVA